MSAYYSRRLGLTFSVMCSSVGIFIFARLLLTCSCFAASNLCSFCFILYVRTFLPSFSFFFRSSLLEFIALFFHFAFSAVNAQVHCHIFYSYTGLFFDCASCLLVLRALAPLALASLCICSFVLLFFYTPFHSYCCIRGPVLPCA